MERRNNHAHKESVVQAFDEQMSAVQDKQRNPLGE